MDSDAESTKTGRAFEGAKALEYYLVALQLVLRKQVEWLVKHEGLDTEIEVRAPPVSLTWQADRDIEGAD